MSIITGNAFAPAAFQTNFASGIQSAGSILAAGMLAQYFNPLGAGPNASAQLASLWMLSLGANAATQAQPPVQPWTASTGPNGQGSVDLGDGYSLALNENNSEITITNAETGETTRIWGDPHVDVDGQHVYDFWGTTTFTLENGTKITVNTEAAANNPDVYYASQLVITKGDQAITVDGISQLQTGDLSISMGNNGRALDAATRDGFVLHENATGSGWRSDATGAVATQADLNATRPGAFYGPGSTAPRLDEFRGLLAGFLLFGLVAGAAGRDR